MAKASMVLIALLVSACAGTPADRSPWHANVESILRENPLAADQNIRVTDLGKADSVSYHVVQVRRGEPLHVHRFHDLSIFVYRGEGSMTMRTNMFTVVAGDMIFVPKGVAHKFVNASRQPSVAVVAFSPGLSGKDFELEPEQ